MCVQKRRVFAQRVTYYAVFILKYTIQLNANTLIQHTSRILLFFRLGRKKRKQVVKNHVSILHVNPFPSPLANKPPQAIYKGEYCNYEKKQSAPHIGL